MELRERLTALGEMSAGIAHELRNPMAVIAGYLALVSKKSAAPEQKIIKDVVAEINGMNRIIDDLLTFARPASLNRVWINIRELVEGCVASVLQAKGKDARTRTVLDLPDLEVSLDEVLMRQALTNLIQNAVEAMPEGGTLTILGIGAGRELSLAITDTGTGIPRDRIKKIFAVLHDQGHRCRPRPRPGAQDHPVPRRNGSTCRAAKDRDDVYGGPSDSRKLIGKKTSPKLAKDAKKSFLPF
jgi:signal transduction histidine kinase